MKNVNTDVKATFISQKVCTSPCVERVYFIKFPDEQQKELIAQFLDQHGITDSDSISYEVTPMQIKITRKLTEDEVKAGNALMERFKSIE